MNTTIEEMLTPCLERVHEANKRSRFRIGLPSEPDNRENRIALTPQAVEVLVSWGHEVYYERGAGKSSRFRDEDYESAGAKVVVSHKESLECEVIVRLTLPTLEESEMISNGAIVISCLNHIKREAEAYGLLAKKGCYILAIDHLRRVGDSDALLDQCLSEVRGQMAMTTASHLLQTNNGEGKGIIVGGVVGVPPTEIVILGADATAFRIAKYALAFGSSVKVFDSSHVRLQRLQDKLGSYNYVFTSIYRPQALDKALKSADILIACGSSSGEVEYYVTKETLKKLKRGAVVLDITPAALSGIETTRESTLDAPSYHEDGHVFQCLPDISMLAAHTSSIIVSDIVASVLNRLGASGTMEEATAVDDYINQGTIMYNGVTTNAKIAEWYGVEYCDIRLLKY
ncbi:MAG: NAD-binding protein [Bacteroidia bacterium]|nr:NAD-binding protein [Bacteroidia bacterium]